MTELTPHRYQKLPNGHFEVESGDEQFVTPWFYLENRIGVARRLGMDRFVAISLETGSILQGTGEYLSRRGVISERYQGNVVPVSRSDHERATEALALRLKRKA